LFPLADEVDQGGEVDGLCEMGAGAQQEGVGDVRFREGVADGKFGDMPKTWLGLQPAEQLKAVKLGRFDTGDEERWGVGSICQEFDGMVGIVRDEQWVWHVGGGERKPHKKNVSIIVIDKEDVGKRHQGCREGV
jgi:hypothetical protein